MRRKSAKYLILAAVLLVGGALAASATPVGTAAAVTPELSAFFSSQGVDAQYLGKPAADVPKDQLVKIDAVVNSPVVTGYTSNPSYVPTPATIEASIDSHRALDGLIGAALGQAMTKADSPVYLQLGTSIFEGEEGLSTDTGWVPLS